MKPTDLYKLGINDITKGVYAKREVRIAFPRFLIEEWRKRQSCDKKMDLHYIAALALNFGLYGPHPYNDPLAAVYDAFEVYPRASLRDHEAREEIVRMVAARLGISVSIAK